MDLAELSLATSLHALVHQQNAISNNLANVGSTAFKRQAGNFEPFETVLHARYSERQTVPRYQERTDFTQGDIAFTGNPHHIALEGEGMLRVRDPGSGEVFLTRNGVLGVDPNGFLTTAGDLHVLDPSGQPIAIGAVSEFSIGPNGEIVDTLAGTQLGVIDRRQVDQPTGLQPIGGGLYRITPAAGKVEPDAFTWIRQSSLENANVNSVSEMVAMIAVQRQFEAVTKALSAVQSTTDQLSQLAQG